MSLLSILPQLIDIERFTGTAVDEYGNEEVTWAVIDAGVRCRLENFSGRQDTDRRDTNTSFWRCYVPPDTDVTQDDRVRDADGLLYEIVTVETQHRPATGPHHMVLWLERKQN
jgi:hypothetical protein